MAIKRYCDACDVEIQRNFVKAIELTHQFKNGLTVRFICRGGTTANHPTIVEGDGDLCSTCAETVLREGKEVE